MDVKMIGIAVIAVMVLSMAGMLVFGIGQESGFVLIAAFSASIAFAAVLFEQWFGKEEKEPSK